MRRFASFAWVLVAVGFLGVVSTAGAAEKKGLYADEGKDKTTGDLKDQDYWWCKWDAKMLEDAIKTRQPEGPISVNVAVGLRRLNELSKKYPKHEDIQKWKKRFEEIQNKLDPNADRGASWKPGFPWDMSNYSQAWVNYHYGKMLMDDNDAEQAYSMFSNVVYNLRLINEHPDLYKELPEESKKFIAETKPKADKAFAELKEKTHH
jgi:hypothetical protein